MGYGKASCASAGPRTLKKRVFGISGRNRNLLQQVTLF